MRGIIKNEGYRGFLKGINVSLLRDASSYGLYFLTFEYLRRKSKQNGIESHMFVDLICGGTAGQNKKKFNFKKQLFKINKLKGSLSWFIIMPLDVIKSRIQSSHQKDLKMRVEFSKVMLEYGWRGFYRGLSALLIRGFLVSSVTFCFYVQSLEILNNHNKISLSK